MEKVLYANFVYHWWFPDLYLEEFEKQDIVPTSLDKFQCKNSQKVLSQSTPVLSTLQRNLLPLCSAFLQMEAEVPTEHW
jgi:hypothetical protein